MKHMSNQKHEVHDFDWSFKENKIDALTEELATSSYPGSLAPVTSIFEKVPKAQLQIKLDGKRLVHDRPWKE